jgi:hypothetical protein
VKSVLLLTLFSLAADYRGASDDALTNNLPLIVGVKTDPDIPRGCIGCQVDEFPKAQAGDVVVLIPFEGHLWRVYCEPNDAVAVQKAWEIPDALDEVNAARAARGLRPFIRDAALTDAAKGAARFRASRRMRGHTSNDFSFIPSGGSATAAGCAAWSPGMGWGSCCTYENYTYAGASWSIGSDGLRYMHLFVR